MGIIDRIRSFLGAVGKGQVPENFDVNSYSNYRMMYSYQFDYLRDVPAMLDDPIISSCLGVIMETAFQPTKDQSIMRVYSKYKTIEDELNTFHASVGMDDYLLTVAYNQMLYGNLPIRIHYNDQMKLEWFSLIPDFRQVVPVIISNKSLGYFYKGEYYNPYDFVYGQLNFYRDLGGAEGIFKMTGNEEIQNEFVFAPSYLASSVRPWRRIKVITDALTQKRLDSTHYMRMIMVNVGQNVFGKNAIKLMNFYRNIFKRVRRVSYDSPLKADKNTAIGSEFEVILPQRENQSISVQDINSEFEIKAIADLDSAYKELFASLKVNPSYIGFSEEAPASLGESPTSRWDERFGRTVSSIRYSGMRPIKMIDVLYLRSRGYNVSQNDFYLTTLSSSTVEDESRRISLQVSADTVKSVSGTITELGVPVNKRYMIKTLFTDILQDHTSMDFEKLFDSKTSGDEIDGEGNLTDEVISSIQDPKIKKGSVSLVVSDTNEAHEFLYKRGIMSEEEYKESKLNAFPILNESDMTKNRIPYNRFLSAMDVYSSYEVDVDLSSAVELKVLEKWRFHNQAKKDVVLPFKGIKIYSSSVITSSKNLTHMAMVISEAYLYEDGVYVDGNNLFNVLWMRDNNYDNIVIDNLYILKGGK